MGPDISSPLVIYSPSVEFRPSLLTGAKQRKERGSGKLPWGGNWNEVEMAASLPHQNRWKLLHHHLLDVSALNNFSVASESNQC